MESSDLMSQRAMLVQANEQSQLQPPVRNGRQRSLQNDGAPGAEAAGVTEWSNNPRSCDETRGWWLLAGL